MKLARFVLVAAAVVGVAIPVARACPSKQKHQTSGVLEMGCARMLMKASADHLSNHLGVTDDQLKRIDEIRYNVRSKAIGYRAQLQQHRLYLERLMNADAPDQNKILREMRKARSVRGRKMEEKVKAYLKILRTLTAEQRKSFRAKCRRHGHGKGHGDKGCSCGKGHGGHGGHGMGHGDKGCSCGKGHGGHGMGHGHGPKKGCSCGSKSCSCGKGRAKSQ